MPKLEEPVTLFFFTMTTSPSLIERHLERITINKLFDLYSNDGNSTFLIKNLAFLNILGIYP
jgi:hypothetical protein